MKINVDQMIRRVEVDSRYPLQFYYRIADNLLKQASIYRDEYNIIDLYVILVRFSSLVSETIPRHRDYQATLLKERSLYKKRLLSMLDELESLKPEFQRCVSEHNEADAASYWPELESTYYGSQTFSLEWPPANNNKSFSMNVRQPTSLTSQLSWKYKNDFSRGTTSNIQIDKQFQNLSFTLPIPNKETLTRHSFLGPNGLRGHWRGPSSQVKVQYPSSTDIISIENSGLNQAASMILWE